MRKMLKRILVFALACNLFVMSVSSANIKAVTDVPRVQSSKVVVRNADLAAWLAGAGITISAETVLAWVLGILGFTAASAAVYENRDSLILWLDSIKQDFLQWCSESKEWCSVKANDFELWLEMVASGTLDKASDCWGALKDYLTDLKSRIDDVNASAGSDGKVIKVDGVGEWLDAHLKNGISASKNTISSSQLTSVGRSLTSAYFPDIGEQISYSDNSQLVVLKFNDGWNLLLALNSAWKTDMKKDFLANCAYISDYGSADIYYSASDVEGIPSFCGSRSWLYAADSVMTVGNLITYEIDYPSSIMSGYSDWLHTPVYLSLATGLVNHYDDWSIEIPKDDGVADDVAAGMTVAGGTAGVIERDGSLDNVDVVGVGGDVITGAKDDVVAVDVDGIDIQDLADPYPGTDTITIDKVGGVIVGTDTPIPDGVTDGQSKPRPKDDYTLPGLQELFPFCIPFDLVMLYRTLTADAEAPCFTWEFVYYLDGKKKTKKIELDLSKFNKVAEIVRMMELLAFMIFLTIKTRDLIRG